MVLIFGLAGGSFVNAFVWRIHKQATSNHKNSDYSIMTGRSMCPHCEHRLSVLDLIPVLSWFMLRGRCRYCHTSISWQYPLVELLTAGLFAVSYLYWPAGFSIAGIVAFVAWLVSLILLITLAVYDLRWMLLPNKLVYPLIGLASVLTVGVSLDNGGGAVLLGAAVGSLFLSGLFYVLFQVSAGAWIGGGDVKLAIALGLLAGGFIESVLLLFVASLLGTLVSLPLVLKSHRLSHKIPFGPFLIAATILVFLGSQPVLDWYTRLIGV